MIKPYSKITTIDMWTDPYISKQMLSYHLSYDNDIASRKLSTIEATTKFLTEYLGSPKTICDFGCGPGLYTNFLEQHGHTVIGVDVSETSLDYARKENKNVQYLNMNYIANTLDTKIDVAMMMYLDFGAMKPEDLSKFLHNVHSTLKIGGLFFFDVYSIYRFDTIKEVKTSHEETDGFFMEGPCAITSTLTKYEGQHITLSHDKAVGQRTIELYNWDKHYTRSAMNELMTQHGFQVIDVFSDTIGNQKFGYNEIYLFVATTV